MPDPRRWGVDVGYHDAGGTWREPPASSIDAVLASMGADRDSPDDEPSRFHSVRLDHELPTVPAGRLVLEDGAEARVGADGRLPHGIPTGYHRLAPADGGADHQVVVSPGTCPLPEGRRWGWAAQLYAARSAASWGIGDLGDLAAIGDWCRREGGKVTLLNPLHAAPPGAAQQPSPYFASSRCFANPLYLRIEDVPGAPGIPGLDRLAAEGRRLNDARLIDRDRVWALKSTALDLLFDRFEASGGDRALDAFVAERGGALAGFATFNAIAEVHGVPWQDWPAELHRPGAPGVRAFASSEAGARRIRLHTWMQWLLDRQLGAVRSTGIIADLAIGVDAGGADSWMWQDTFAEGMRVGAPPDEFNTLGQDWGLPPWDPWRLRADAYEPFVQTVRAGLRHAEGLRFDHVMGLFRLFWIPTGASAGEGTFVRYPYWDLLNILALEAERAGAYVVGEDLGTVEDHVRRELRERRVLSYKLLWFEDAKPQDWDGQALGAVTTHDLPTVTGVWSGADLDAQRDLGLEPNEAGSKAMRDRLEDWTGADAAAPAAEVTAAAYALLGEAPCAVLTVSLDDLAGVEERPNMPGTVDEWPNWRIGLPVPIEELMAAPLPAAVVARLRAAGAGGESPEAAP